MELFLLLATLFVFGLLVSSLLPLQLAVGVTVSLLVFQLYTVSTAGVYFSLAHLGALSLWRHARQPKVVSHLWFGAALVLLLVQIVSVIWSPAPLLAVRQLFYSLPFFFVTCAVYSLAKTNFLAIRKIFLIALLSSVVQALLIILFRVSPRVELSFLGSGAARFFISSNILGELTNGAYTVFDPGKAGGIFVNANVAAVFGGFLALFAWGCTRLFGAPWLRWVALINWVSVFFAGSKAGIGLAVLIPVVMYLIGVVRARRISILVVANVCIGMAIGGALLAFLLNRFLESSYVGASSQTMDERLKIWRFAWMVIERSPFTGLGYGGWEREWPTYALAHGSNPFFPPHNAFLALFMQSGVVAILAGATFVIGILAFVWRQTRLNNPASAAYAQALFFGLVWVFVQAQGENYGLLGEIHLTLLMAAAVGLAVFLSGKESVRA